LFLQVGELFVHRHAALSHSLVVSISYSNSPRLSADQEYIPHCFSNRVAQDTARGSARSSEIVPQQNCNCTSKYRENFLSGSWRYWSNLRALYNPPLVFIAGVPRGMNNYFRGFSTGEKVREKQIHPIVRSQFHLRILSTYKHRGSTLHYTTLNPAKCWYITNIWTVVFDFLGYYVGWACRSSTFRNILLSLSSGMLTHSFLTYPRMGSVRCPETSSNSGKPSRRYSSPLTIWHQFRCCESPKQ
jgi:hypothetical protein